MREISATDIERAAHVIDNPLVGISASSVVALKEK
jgi:hypothetical protein